jgi:hypothetical protein
MTAENAKFVAYYTAGETIVAVASMGMDPIMTKSAELMKANWVPTVPQLRPKSRPKHRNKPLRFE